MGHLYYQELGGVFGSSPPAFGVFQNVQAAQYWTGTEYSLDTSLAIYFPMNNGFQTASGKAGNEYAAWAVRNGDVVPAPATVWLLATGLAGLGGRRLIRRKVSA